MREDYRKGVYVENLCEVEVASVQDIVHLLLLVRNVSLPEFFLVQIMSSLTLTSFLTWRI